MPMDRRAIVFQIILDGDFNRIAPTGLYPGTGIRFIERFATVRAIDAISIDVEVGNVEVVLKATMNQQRPCVVCLDSSLSKGSHTFLRVPVGQNES